MSRDERLKKAIIYLKSNDEIYYQKDFADKIGVSNTNLSSAIRGSEKYLSDAFFRKVVIAYPEFSLDWFLTGSGDMIVSQLPSNTPTENISLPLVNLDSVGGMDSQNAILEPEYIEKYVPFADARTNDFCIYQSGNSMSPEIPPGTILHVREVVDWQDYIGYGGYFVLVLDDDRRITKIVDKSAIDATKFVLCKSINPEHADEELPRAKIVRVFKIIHVLINSGW